MKYSYLALGDSYTIGEQVPLHENFPYQTIQLLRNYYNDSHEFYAVEIVAKTGWTTDELSNQISKNTFLPQYDFVSLLIGVNNQYRGRTVENYKSEFEKLLSQAIAFAGGNSKRVFVISIPDWGSTTFAEGRDRIKIAAEIDEYNLACKEISLGKSCVYLDITTSQRIDSSNQLYTASDGLHPSGIEYTKWAKALSKEIIKAI